MHPDERDLEICKALDEGIAAPVLAAVFGVPLAHIEALAGELEALDLEEKFA